MTASLTRYLQAALIGLVLLLLSSCSRPVAYFQKSPNPVVSPTSVNTQPLGEATPDQPTASSEALLKPIDTALPSVDAYVRNGRSLAGNKQLVRRLNRVEQLLAATHEQRVSASPTTPRSLKGVDRLIIRKLNKQIGQHLAPAHPQKAMVANRVVLIGGIVFLLGGLLLLILGTGTGAFIGLIVALIGALGTILGLFGE